MDTTSAAFEGVPSLPGNYFSDNTHSFNTNIINNYVVEGALHVPKTFQELTGDPRWGMPLPDIDEDHLGDKYNLPEADTGKWIFETVEYKEWRRSSQPKLLWLCGGPGTGKTMLVKLITAELLKECYIPPRGAILAFHFVSPELSTEKISADYAELQQCSLAKVARDLLYWILKQDGSLFDGCKVELATQGARFFTNKCSLWKVLRKAVEGCQAEHVHILIDGVDGLKGHLCLELVKRFRELAKIPKVKILLSSQVVSHVANSLPGDTKINLDGNDFVKEDVKAFIESKVKDLEGWDENQKERVREALLTRAEGTFLWVSIAIENLACRGSSYNLDTFLEEFPPELNGVYQKMVHPLIEYGGSKKVLSMIECVALALRPLTFGEFGYIMESMERGAESEQGRTHGGANTEIWPTEKDIQGAIMSSMGFLRGVAGTVSIVHHTATKYLFDEMCKDGLPILSRTKSELSVSWECFQYLHRAFGDPEKFPRRDAKRDHSKSRDPSSGQDSQDGEQRETLRGVAQKNPHEAVAKWPYLRYSAESWFIHAHRSIDVSGDKFYDDSARDWLRYQFFETGDVIRKPWAELCGDPKMQALVGDQTPVHIAVGLGLMPLVEKAFSDLAETRDSNRSLLHLAAVLRSQAYETLIDKGGLILLTARDQDDNTPLHEAAIFGHWPMLKALVEKFEKSEDKAYSKEIDSQNSHGNTPLHLALRFDQPEMVKFLVQRGASVTIKNQDRLTALELGRDLEREESLDILKQAVEIQNTQAAPQSPPPAPPPAPPQAPRESLQQAPQQPLQQAPPQAPPQPPQQVPPQAPLQAPQQAPRQAPQRAPQQAPQQAPPQAPRQPPQQVPRQPLQQAPLQGPPQSPLQSLPQSPPRASRRAARHPPPLASLQGFPQAPPQKIEARGISAGGREREATTNSKRGRKWVLFSLLAICLFGGILSVPIALSIKKHT